VDFLEAGLYEALLTEGLAEAIRTSDRDLVATRRLKPYEAPDRIALHLANLIRSSLSSISEDGRVEKGIELVRLLSDRLAELLSVGDVDQVVEPGTVLHAIFRRRPDGSARPIPEPLTPLLDTTLLTNAPGEPNLWSQLLEEAKSADSIDVVMAFIRRSGIAPLVETLRRHCAEGLPLRILTTTYTGSTEQSALDLLSEIGAQVRISYDLTSTRLHAKAWLFHRMTGFSTAFIGSSNLTYSAQVTGLEWNIRASSARNPDVLSKFAAVFESYWQSNDFVAYDSEEFKSQTARAHRTGRGPVVILPGIELRPEPFQERLLELLTLSRDQGHHRNLLVSATGTGKTVMAAVDYGRLRDALPRSRLLFVAHREEILDQSLGTFRYALRDANFGEKWVGGARPEQFEYVFASVQSLNSADLTHLSPTHFDVVVIDEFHHAAAPSYRKLLDHVSPEELLGLTATPERTDGLPILQWFDDRIAAELRLWDAVDQGRLSPFMYYGIHDGMDLTDVPWRRGQGYDVSELSNIYTASDAWARLVLNEVKRHVDNPEVMRAFGFCVSVEHAQFMARHFAKHGVGAVAIWGDSPETDRKKALSDLAAGKIQVVFSVDLFNEGVDVPSLDTILMLRPTDSPTLFMQQLGRGLRRCNGKSFCTVLDFVGTHRKEFRADRRFRALLGGSRRSVEEAVKQGFPFLPAGCHLHLDQKSQEVVLAALRNAVPSRWPAKVEELRHLRMDAPETTLADFLSESGLELEELYEGNRSWSDLLEAVRAPILSPGPNESVLRRALGRLLHVDDHERTSVYLRYLQGDSAPDVVRLVDRDRRLLHMLVDSVTEQAISTATTLQEATDLLWRHPQVRSELSQLLELLRGRIDHVHEPLDDRPNVPLQIHARYTRREIMAAYDVGLGAKVQSWQSGAFHVNQERSDLFAFTLDKTSGSFSPTTRYQDYAISPRLIHWESQSSTREDSPTGLRYRNHASEGRSIMLFARLRADDRAFWCLGTGQYRGHTGEKPMAITWALDHPLPGDLYAAFAAAVA
jgi:superfamily II DNA or RNA helicase